MTFTDEVLRKVWQVRIEWEAEVRDRLGLDSAAECAEANAAGLAAMRAVLEGQPCECSLALVQSLNAAKEENKALTGAYWALCALEEKHEALRVAVMIEVSHGPEADWPAVRLRLGAALNEAHAASDRSQR